MTREKSQNESNSFNVSDKDKYFYTAASLAATL
jgi:hypothetical protein